MTDQKTAAAELKKAQKAWETADKKAKADREKYLVSQAAANQAARELDWAAANPALFADEPLDVVQPRPVAPPLTLSISGNVFAGPPPGGEAAKYVIPAPSKPAQIVVEDNTLTSIIPGSGGDEPWEQPVLVQQGASPTEEKAPPKRRRTAKAKEEGEPTPIAPEAPPWEQPTPSAPPAQQPVVVPPGKVHVGFTIEGQPIFADAEPAAPAAPPAGPPPPPWETGEAPLY